jgi:hypothetical protein
MERGDSESVEWSDEMTLTLIEVLLDEMKRGTRSDTGFKLSSYQRVREQVNLTKDWKGRTPNVSLVHVKNKFNNVCLLLNSGDHKRCKLFWRRADIP